MINKLWVFLLLPAYCWAQTITGTIVDADTNQPLETVSVYFDNTTVGTTTNEKGEFSITYTDAIQSSLVISYLGYEKMIINDYRDKDHVDIVLKPSSFALDEVNLDYDDGLTRKQKLSLFRTHFLGTTSFGKSCEIKNEDAITLRYNKKGRILSASSDSPVIVINKALGYEIQYDLNDFEVRFRYLDEKSLEYTLELAYYLGTVFFKDMNQNNPKRRIVKKREKAYKGSIQHFMRALFNKDLKSEGYTVFRRGFKINEWGVFKVEPIEDSERKRVSLASRVSVLYNKKDQSDIFLHQDITSFTVDKYGHYEPILGLYFTGYMNQLRVGDMLPLDYGLE